MDVGSGSIHECGPGWIYLLFEGFALRGSVTMETQALPCVVWTRTSLWYVSMAVSGLRGLTVWSESAPSVGFSGFLFRRATRSNWHPALEKLTSGQHQGGWEPDRTSGGQETIVLPKGKSKTNILLPRLHRSWSIPPGRLWKNLHFITLKTATRVK